MASVFDKYQEQESSVFARTPEMTWGDVASGAYESAIPSATHLAGSVWEAVKHPIMTAKTVWDLGSGALQAALPESLVQMIGEDKQSRDLAKKVGEFYVGRYGSLEGAKQAIASDPAGVLADAATVLGVGAGALGAASKTAQVGGMTKTASALEKAANVASKTAEFVDPLQLATKAVVNPAIGTAKLAAGKLSGAGTTATEEAYAAGKAGGEAGKAFRQNIREQVDPEVVLANAKNALSNMRQAKNQQYKANKTAITQDKTVLAFDDVNKALNDAYDSLNYKGQFADESAASRLAEVADEISRWQNLDPAKFHTPEGMDVLKQRMDALLEKIPFEQRNSRRVVGTIKSSIKDTIAKQAPVYNKMMSDYSQSSDLITEVERALSLGNRKSADTALRKLQSVMRNNVNTNFGARLRFAKELEKYSKQPIIPALAGQALAETTPRGLAGQLAPLNISQMKDIGGLGIAAGAGLMSPRVTGEVSHVAGRLMGIAPEAPYGLLSNLMYQANQ